MWALRPLALAQTPAATGGVRACVRASERGQQGRAGQKQPQEGRLRLSASRCLQSLSKPPIILLSAHSSTTHTTHTNHTTHYHQQYHCHSLSIETERETDPLHHPRNRLAHSQRSRDAPASTTRRIHPRKPRDRPPRLSHPSLFHQTLHGRSTVRFNG